MDLLQRVDVAHAVVRRRVRQHAPVLRGRGAAAAGQDVEAREAVTRAKQAALRVLRLVAVFCSQVREHFVEREWRLGLVRRAARDGRVAAGLQGNVFQQMECFSTKVSLLKRTICACK